VSETQAAPRIQQFLHNQRVSSAVGKEMKRLKDSAKVEYMGEFAEGAPAKAAAAPAPAANPAASAPPRVANPAPAAVPSAAAPAAADPSAASQFEKGIRGLR
jgi:hypothetical protein